MQEPRYYQGGNHGYVIDITKRDDVLRLSKEGFDAVIHLAAYPNPRTFTNAGALRVLM